MEGMVAYERYNIVMRRLAKKYDTPLEIVCAVFCALSPNSDYFGNLRSTVSVLQGLRDGTPSERIVVSTYGHCKSRAIEYARGFAQFVQPERGPKILNFYHNILAPHSSRWVTIDGHMVAIWRDQPQATMKESIVHRSEYETIAHAVKAFAFHHFMLPHQMQATLWFARKRLQNVRYDPQLDWLAEFGDAWKTLRNVDEIFPYTYREGKAMEAEAASLAPCMFCQIPANCKQAGQCLAFTQRQDPEEVKR
jgi:hypothetical protein